MNIRRFCLCQKRNINLRPEYGFGGSKRNRTPFLRNSSNTKRIYLINVVFSVYKALCITIKEVRLKTGLIYGKSYIQFIKTLETGVENTYGGGA